MIKTDKNIRESFKLFKKCNKDSEVDINTFIDLCSNFNKFLIDKILDGHEIVLPEKLGTFSIQGIKQEIKFDDKGNPNLPPDWVKTKALWERCEECKEKKQLVYHTNDHTNGVRYKLVWSKKNSITKYKVLYSFRLTRDNKRAIHKKVLDNKEYYVK